MSKVRWVMCAIFVANFISAEQKFWKSVKIWQSYRDFKGGNFFETQCISTDVTANVSVRSFEPWNSISGLTFRLMFFHFFTRGEMHSEFGRIPDSGTRSLLPGQIRVVARSGYLTCDLWHCFCFSHFVWYPRCIYDNVTLIYAFGVL